jgi:hypothetical protein
VNGGIRRVAAGSVVFVEDTTGKATISSYLPEGQ